MFNAVKLIERNMCRNLRRTILTILTIALAAFIYTVLVSVPASMDRVIKDASGTLRLFVVNKTAPWEDLPARYCDQIDKMPGAAACVGITGWFATWRDVSDPILAFGGRAGNRRCLSRLSTVSRKPDAWRARDRRSATVGTVLMKKNGMEGRRPHHPARHRRGPYADGLHHHRYDREQALPEHLPVPARLPDGIAQGQRTCPTRTSRGTSSCARTAPLICNRSRRTSMSTSPTPTMRRARMTESDAFASGLSALGNIRGSCSRCARSWC